MPCTASCTDGLRRTMRSGLLLAGAVVSWVYYDQLEYRLTSLPYERAGGQQKETYEGSMLPLIGKGRRSATEAKVDHQYVGPGSSQPALLISRACICRCPCLVQR